MLVSSRSSLEGVEESFVDNMARGLDAWTSAAGRDLIRWGFMVLQKSVSFRDGLRPAPGSSVWICPRPCPARIHACGVCWASKAFL